MALRTTRITVETDIFIVVRRAKATVAWCPECALEVNVITLRRESLTDPATSAELERWMSTGKLHLWHLPDGTVHVCVNSLLQSSA
jgi:hypothetical protein